MTIREKLKSVLGDDPRLDACVEALRGDSRERIAAALSDGKGRNLQHLMAIGRCSQQRVSVVLRSLGAVKVRPGVWGLP